MFYEARGGALAAPVQVPAGLDNAQESLSRSLPAAKTALDAYFRELKHLYRTLHDLEDKGSLGPSALLDMLFSGHLFELIGARVGRWRSGSTP